MTRLKMLAAALVLATVFPAGLAVAQDYVSPYAYPQPEEGTDFFTVIEIPQGSFTKYEIDAETGHVIVDRYQAMPVVYPANYGSIPSSLGGDGDPLDALVYTREPVVPGAMIKVRAIGVLKMIDGGEEDHKVVAVPASDIDPTYDNIRNIEDLPAIERQRLLPRLQAASGRPEGGRAQRLRWGRCGAAHGDKGDHRLSQPEPLTAEGASVSAGAPSSPVS
jgi:inorganic pyrophosphatase